MGSPTVDILTMQPTMDCEDPMPTICSEIMEGHKGPFFSVDLGNLYRKHVLWRRELPGVQPHYAVKCSDDDTVLSTLAELGVNFDCASKNEIEQVLRLGFPPQRIIYANTCKQPSYLEYANSMGIEWMTFDNENELFKISSICPQAKLLLRLQVVEPTKSLYPLGRKFGCPASDIIAILRLAKRLGMNISGVSFHVGNGCIDVSAFGNAVKSARRTFDIAALEGFHFDVLDIGGGFPGQDNTHISFQSIALELRRSFKAHFPESCGVRIIGEPGTFYVGSAFTLAANVIGKRAVCDGKPHAADEPTVMYYLNDGIYGTLRIHGYGPIQIQCCSGEGRILEAGENGLDSHWSRLWGPTCDELDIVQEKVLLPELNLGDWVCFRNMGAYTLSMFSLFNGMEKARCVYYGEVKSALTCIDSNGDGAEYREKLCEEDNAH